MLKFGWIGRLALHTTFLSLAFSGVWLTLMFNFFLLFVFSLPFFTIPKRSHWSKRLCVPCICRTPPESFSNSSKVQIWTTKTNFRGVIFPEGASPLRADWNPESLASCKVVYREVCTEGSMTAKVCTDEQKVHKRHSNKDEYPQQYEVQNSVLNMLLNQIIVM